MIDLAGNHHHHHYPVRQSEIVKFSEMDLSGYNNVDIVNHHLKIASQIKQVTFAAKSKLATIPRNIFKCFQNLEKLDMCECDLRYFDQNTFKDADCLLELILWLNEIKILDNDTFAHASNLRYLDLKFNLINEIHSNAFNGLNKLTSLILCGNELTTLPPGLFEPLENLETIMLCENFIEEIHEDLFVNNPKLRNIRLNGNKIKYISPKSFAQMKNLEHLYLGSNNLRKLCLIGSFSVLNLEQNQMEFLFIDGPVEELNLTNMNLKKIIASDLTKLKILKVSGNSDLDLDFLKSAYNLEDLEMTSMNINILQDDTNNIFKNLTKLRSLNLSDNNLIQLNIKALHSLKSLEKLYLNGNKLMEFDYRGLVYNHFNLKSINVAYNRLKLDFVKDMLGFFRSRAVRNFPIVKNSKWIENNGSSEAFHLSL